MIFRPWDVVAIPFPFIQRTAATWRPALVLSREEFNRVAGHTLLAMITTRMHRPRAGDTAITDNAAAGLTVPCMVRLKLFTFDNQLLRRRLGHLAPADEMVIRSQLTKMLEAQ